MIVRPVLPSRQVIDALQPSLERSNVTWVQIAEWFNEGTACFWQIGSQAWVLTSAKADDTIEILLAGGRGAIKCAKPFVEAMEQIPEHRGKTLRIEGRTGWRRFYLDWQCEEVGGGDVILTKRL